MLNHVVIQGRLTRDPDLRTTQSGISVASFTVAWSEKRGETETRLFLNCTAWRSTGEMVSRYFHKGQEIIVEGKLSTRDWTDKEGGKRSSNELTVEHVHFCGPKQDGGTSNTYAAAPAPAPQSDFAELTDDDGTLPFN